MIPKKLGFRIHGIASPAIQHRHLSFCKVLFSRIQYRKDTLPDLNLMTSATAYQQKMAAGPFVINVRDQNVPTLYVSSLVLVLQSKADEVVWRGGWSSPDLLLFLKLPGRVHSGLIPRCRRRGRLPWKQTNRQSIVSFPYFIT